MAELDTLFPDRKVGDLTVRPYNFGQMGTALRILAPFTSALDLSTAEMSLESINLPVLMYAATDGDCQGIFELCAMACGENIDFVKALDSERGMELLKATWEVSISPEIERIRKKFVPKDQAAKGKKKAKATGGPIQSSSSPGLDLPEKILTD